MMRETSGVALHTNQLLYHSITYIPQEIIYKFEFLSIKVVHGCTVASKFTGVICVCIIYIQTFIRYICTTVYVDSTLHAPRGTCDAIPVPNSVVPMGWGPSRHGSCAVFHREGQRPGVFVCLRAPIFWLLWTTRRSMVFDASRFRTTNNQT